MTNFRSDGTYHSEGEYDSELRDLNEIYEEVHDMAKLRSFPSLVGIHGTFFVLVDVPDHQYNVPRIVTVE